MKYDEWKQAEALKRFKERREIKKLLQKYRPKKRISIEAVSGGLPSLGKKR
jgi:hypothetical protein